MGVNVKVKNGTLPDLDRWMALVEEIRESFPGLETPEALAEHRAAVRRFMERGEALCVEAGEEIGGVLLFSGRRAQICFLGVSPKCRRQGIAAALLGEALRRLGTERRIVVITFREGDPCGDAPRPLYERFGFRPGELVEEFGYPLQVLIREQNLRCARDSLQGGL